MTVPQDPFDPASSPPADAPPPFGQQGGYGQPPPGYGQPVYGQPQPGQQGWGQPGQGAPPRTGTNGMAIGALVAAFFCSPLGIVLGLVARNQIKSTGQGGSGLATAAIVIGAVSMLLGLALVLGA